MSFIDDFYQTYSLLYKIECFIDISTTNTIDNLTRVIIHDNLTCEIIMNNHTCEIIDCISGGNINKTLYFI